MPAATSRGRRKPAGIHIEPELDFPFGVVGGRVVFALGTLKPLGKVHSFVKTTPLVQSAPLGKTHFLGHARSFVDSNLRNVNLEGSLHSLVSWRGLDQSKSLATPQASGNWEGLSALLKDLGLDFSFDSRFAF